MMSKYFEILKHRGSAMVNVIVASTVVGVGAIMLSHTGDERGKMTLDMNQNSLIENTVFDIRVKLANRAVCDAAMATGFTEIGEYKTGFDVGLNVTIREIRVVQPLANEVVPDRAKKILIAFTKEQKSKGLKRDRGEFVFIQEFDEDGDGTMDFCTSVETLGINNAFSQICSSIAGPSAFDAVSGQCNTDILANPIFNQTLNRIACQAIGAQYNSGTGRCDKVDINGTIYSSHLKDNEIVFPGVNQKRTAFRDFSCAGTNFALGVNEDGSLDCANPSCPQGEPGGSSYSLGLLNGEVYCTCNKNRARREDGARVACGSADPNSCISYPADDGCGMGTTCTIRRGLFPDCSCANGLYDDQSCTDTNCGTTCWGTIPRPPPPPPPPPPESAGCGSTINTCNPGTPSGLSTVGDTSTWTCTEGSDTANCTYTASASCGPANGGEYATAPSSGLCSSGGASGFSENATGYSWNCGTNSCSATKPEDLTCPNSPSSTLENIGSGRIRCTQVTYSAAPDCEENTRIVTSNQCQQIVGCSNGQMASTQSNGICTWQRVTTEDDCVLTHPHCDNFLGNTCDGNPSLQLCEKGYLLSPGDPGCQHNVGLRCMP